MDIIISDESRTETRISLELTCGNKTAYLSFSPLFGTVDVCVQNASHRVWRGAGRTFNSFQEALDGYKSAEVKAMIRHLMEETKPQLSVVG